MATSSSDVSRALGDLVRAIAKSQSEANTLRRKLLRVTAQRDDWRAVAIRYRKKILEIKT